MRLQTLMCVYAAAEPVFVGLKNCVCGSGARVSAEAEPVFVGLQKSVYAAAELELVRLNKCVCVCG